MIMRSLCLASLASLGEAAKNNKIRKALVLHNNSNQIQKRSFEYLLPRNE